MFRAGTGEEHRFAYGAGICDTQELADCAGNWPKVQEYETFDFAGNLPKVQE